MPILNLEAISEYRQFAKISEETDELLSALNEDCKIEECIDVIQAAMGLLIKLTQTKQGLENALMKHWLKLACREANGGYKLIGDIKIDIKLKEE